MADLNISYQDISSHYNEIKSVLTHIELSKRVKPQLNKIVNWATIDAHNKKLVNDFSSLESFEERVILNSLFLSTIAAFESYLRALISGVIIRIEKKEKIPKRLQDRNIQLTGVALTQIYSPLSHLKLDYPKLCTNLGTIDNESVDTKLNEEISFFIKNVLELDNVFKFLDDCEIRINWDDFGRISALKTLLKTAKNRETSNALREELKKYLNARNRIAHTGLNSSDITSPEIHDAIDIILFVSKYINSVCENTLK